MGFEYLYRGGGGSFSGDGVECEYQRWYREG